MFKQGEQDVLLDQPAVLVVADVRVLVCQEPAGLPQEDERCNNIRTARRALAEGARPLGQGEATRTIDRNRRIADHEDVVAMEPGQQACLQHATQVWQHVLGRQLG